MAFHHHVVVTVQGCNYVVAKMLSHMFDYSVIDWSAFLPCFQELYLLLTCLHMCVYAVIVISV